MFSQLGCFGPHFWWYDCNFFLLFQRAPPTTGCELFLAHSTAPSPAGPRWRSTPGRAEHTCASSTADLATCVRWNQWLTLAWVSSMHITRLTLDKGRGCRIGVTVRFWGKTNDICRIAPYCSIWLLHIVLLKQFIDDLLQATVFFRAFYNPVFIHTLIMSSSGHEENLIGHSVTITVFQHATVAALGALPLSLLLIGSQAMIRWSAWRSIGQTAGPWPGPCKRARWTPPWRSTTPERGRSLC